MGSCNIYIVECSVNDMSYTYILSHKRRYTYSEFEELFKRALEKATRSLLGEDRFIGVETLVEKAVEILKTEYGFQEPEYTVSYYVSGSTIITSEDLPFQYTLRKLLPRNLLDMIVEHNEKKLNQIHEAIKT